MRVVLDMLSLDSQPNNFLYPANVKDLWTPNRQSLNDQLIHLLFQQAIFVPQYYCSLLFPIRKTENFPFEGIPNALIFSGVLHYNTHL
jgi:hypothetical protein